MSGEAEFSPAGTSLNYDEAGTLTFGLHEGPASQHCVYEFGAAPQRALVRFRDGRLFHELDLSAGEAAVSHVCAADSYEGRFTVHDQGRWQCRWTVVGPGKNQEIVTVFTPLA